jgi:hypothetical protein
MMVADSKKPKWFFYPEWVVLSTLSILFAWLMSWAIISQVERVVGGTMEVAGRTRITEDFLFNYTFVPLLILLTGLLQYLLLRRYLPRMGWWIVATAVGWPLGIVAVYFGNAIWPVVLNANSIWSAALVGAVIGLAQWLVLRRRVSHAGWGVLATALGWGLVRLIAGEVFISPVELLIIGAVPATVTGLALWWLLAHSPQHETAVG